MLREIVDRLDPGFKVSGALVSAAAAVAAFAVVPPPWSYVTGALLILAAVWLTGSAIHASVAVWRERSRQTSEEPALMAQRDAPAREYAAPVRTVRDPAKPVAFLYGSVYDSGPPTLRAAVFGVEATIEAVWYVTPWGARRHYINSDWEPSDPRFVSNVYQHPGEDTEPDPLTVPPERVCIEWRDEDGFHARWVKVAPYSRMA